MGDTNDREGDEKSVANWQTTKKPAVPLALKSSHAMPPRLRRRLRHRGQVRTASLTKVATDDEPLLSRSCLGEVAVLCDEIQQQVVREVIQKPHHNSRPGSERSAESASIPAPV